MGLILVLFKFYIIVLLFRLVSTQQELTFNPVGRVIAKLTNPVFTTIKVQKQQERMFIILMILSLVLLGSFLSMLFLSDMNRGTTVFLSSISNFLSFFMLLFMASVLIGSVVNRGNAGIYVAYFFRLAVPWVKITRLFVPINTGAIIFATIPVIFIIFYVFQFAIAYITFTLAGSFDLETNLQFQTLSSIASGSAIVPMLKVAFMRTFIAFISLFTYAAWLIIARALMSWVNPDPSNAIVQLIYGLTEPILSPLRRYIPPIGMLDLSAMVAIIGLFFISSVLQRLLFLL